MRPTALNIWSAPAPNTLFCKPPPNGVTLVSALLDVLFEVRLPKALFPPPVEPTVDPKLEFDCATESA